jgi:hypothetical protein
MSAGLVPDVDGVVVTLRKVLFILPKREGHKVMSIDKNIRLTKGVAAAG